jgi:hypothetical protein
MSAKGACYERTIVGVDLDQIAFPNRYTLPSSNPIKPPSSTPKQNIASERTTLMLHKQ